MYQLLVLESLNYINYIVELHWLEGLYQNRTSLFH